MRICRKDEPDAPSIIGGSRFLMILIRLWPSSCPSNPTGRSSSPPMPRIPASGSLVPAVDSSSSNMPRVDTE